MKEKITYGETNQLLNEILSTFAGVTLTDDERYDLIIAGMSSLIDNPEVVSIKSYVKSTMINCVKDKIKEHMHELFKEV